MKSQTIIVLGVNGVVVGHHGLILEHNEATGSRKVSGYLPGLRDTIKKIKRPPKSKNPKNSKITYFPVYLTPDIPPWRLICYTWEFD